MCDSSSVSSVGSDVNNGDRQDEVQIVNFDSNTSIESLMQFVLSEEVGQRAEAITFFRKKLSVPDNPPIDGVIQAGLVPELVKALEEEQDTGLPFEAAWALTNICSGTTEHVQHVVSHGALPLLVQFLSVSVDSDLEDQCIWALGNIAGDDPKFRDMVLESGALQPTMDLLERHCSARLNIARNASWLLSNLCRGSPPPPFEMVSPLLEFLTQLFGGDCLDAELQQNAQWAYGYLVDVYVHAGIALPSNSIRSFVRFQSGKGGGDSSEAPFFAAVDKLLKACGGDSAIQEMMDAGLAARVQRIVQKWSELPDSSAHCVSVIKSVMCGGLPQHAEALADTGCVEPLVACLGDNKLAEPAIRALLGLLTLGRCKQRELRLSVNPFAKFMDQATFDAMDKAALKGGCVLLTVHASGDERRDGAAASSDLSVSATGIGGDEKALVQIPVSATVGDLKDAVAKAIGGSERFALLTAGGSPLSVTRDGDSVDVALGL